MEGPVKIVCWDCQAKHDLVDTDQLLDGTCPTCGGAFNRKGHAILRFEPSDTKDWRKMKTEDSSQT